MCKLATEKFLRRIGFGLGVICLCFQIPTAQAAATDQMVLTNAAQIRDLTQNEAANALPARLRGVAVWSKWGELVLVDESSGIYCHGLAVQAARLHSGDVVEVEGVTDPGKFAPFVEAQTARKVGESQIPEPKRVTYDDLRDGSWDGQWVAITGIVRESGPLDRTLPSGDTWKITLFTSGYKMTALLTREQGEQARVGARIQLRGVCFYQFNEFRQVVRPVLAVDWSERVTILNPGPKAFFQLPVQPIETLLEFNPKGTEGRCVRVQGRVTLVEPDSGFWITEGEQGAHILTIPPAVLHLGDQVDVVGFLNCEEGFPILEDAQVHIAGKTSAVTPIRLGTPDQAQKHNGALVTLDGIIRSRLSTIEGCRLDLEAGANRFTAFWPASGKISAPTTWQPGTVVRVTGICVTALEAPPLLPGALQLQALKLILRSPADIQIFQAAPWWTPEHTSRVLAATLTTTIIAGASIFLGYRRRAARRLAAVRVRESLAEERARIARDLHDDLGANLAEIAMVSELARQALPSNDPARSQFDDIFTRAEANTRRLGEIVWSVNPANDTLENFATYLSKFAQDHIVLAGVHCRLTLPETLPTRVLTSIQRHHLLLATKEAIHNAIVHGKPRTITLKLALQGGRLQIMVEDDGCGFDEPSGANPTRGSANMRKRMDAIGGTFERKSVPEHGTIVILGIPFES